MDGWFSRSFITAASAPGGFSFPSGGLNAAPAAMLGQALPQLARLSLFRASLELQRLFQCMHQVVEAQGHSVGLGAAASGTEDGGLVERPDSGITASDDDDFPDTQAFDDEEVPVPMLSVDRSPAMGAGGL